MTRWALHSLDVTAGPRIYNTSQNQESIMSIFLTETLPLKSQINPCLFIRIIF